jgi:serine/threonine protein kinase
MNADWSHLEELFAQAIALNDSERAGFVEQACAGAPELRAELDSLLAAHEQAEASFAARSLAVRDILGALGRGLLTGQSLGPYRMGSIIGEGGMGIVYQATDTPNDAPVAIKVLPHEISLDSPWRKRFAREVRATAAIDHPSVVRILDTGEDSGCLYLVMELIPGESLRAVLQCGALPLDKVLDYGTQVACALEAAHAAGVIHHDLKPGNIMVQPEGSLKVVDFGLSRFQDDSGGDSARTRLSQVGTPAGTIDYLSPEQAGGRPVDARSDLFAMGSVLYEMLAGRRAFHRATNLETAAAILRDQPAPLPNSIPAPVVRLVSKCLAKDADARVQSATDLRAALESLREKLHQGKLKPQRFRRAFRIAAWAAPAALVAAALTIAAMSASRGIALHPPRFQRLTDDPHLTSDPALSLDGRWLAYASDRAEDGNLDIWIQPTGQGSARRLTNDPAVDYQPSLSPDGSLLAFRSEREPAGIYIMPSAGGEAHLLAAGGREPRFSPDGKWIAYWTGPAVNADPEMIIHSAIFVIPASGGTPRRLAASLPGAEHPVWSPDSRTILFAGGQPSREMNEDFWAVPLAGGAPELKARWPMGIGYTLSPPQPLAWPEEDSVLFKWLQNGSAAVVRIWRMRFPKHPASEMPVADPITSGKTPYTWCAIDRTGRMVAASGTSRSAVWSQPVEPDTAQMHGAMSPLVVEGEQQLLSSMTANGKMLLFTSTDRRGERRLIIQDFDAGQQTILGTSVSLDQALLTRDGRWVSVRATWEQQNRPFAEILTLPPGMGIRSFPYRLGSLTEWDLNRDGTLALAYAATEPRSVALQTLQSADPVPLLVHPELNLYLANFSPDDRWILVTAENGVDPPHLFAIPFLQPYPIPVRKWVDLGEGVFGRWAPSGNRVYFLRDHQGSRCLYTLALDSATKRPAGEAQALLHFHSAWRSPVQLEPGFFRVLVAPDKLIFSLGETQSNLWLSEP